MPQLNINFTKGTGAVDFQVCHKPDTSPTWICQTYPASVTLPIVITQGIVCGTSYDVRVKKYVPQTNLLKSQRLLIKLSVLLKLHILFRYSLHWFVGFPVI